VYVGFKEGKEWEQAFAIMREALEKLEAETKKLAQAADTATGKAMKVERVDHIMRSRYSVSTYAENRVYPYGKLSVAATVAAAKKHAEELWTKVQEIHQGNVPAIEANDATRLKVIQIMQNIGIPSAQTFYTIKRGKERTHTERSGYLNDLDRYLVINDGYDQASADYRRFIAEIEEYERKQGEIEREAKAAQEAEKERQDRERRMTVAVVEVAKELGVDPLTEDAASLLDKILDRDKYLKLAYAMYQTRGDWTGGPWCVEHALESFKIETADDNAIYNEISALTYNWEGDGRVYRDCTWNYTRLFDMAHSHYKEMYDKLTEFVS
jgi:hypothetical protein